MFAPHTYSLTLSNKSMKKLLFSLIAVGFLATSCATDTATDTAAAPDAAAETTEAMPMEDMEGMESSSEGDYEFEIVSPETAVPTGDAEVVVAITDAATGEPVTTENLSVDVYMPEMEGMEKMTTESEVVPGSEPGTYTVNTYLSMAGSWVVHSVVDEDGKEGVGHLMIEAQ